MKRTIVLIRHAKTKPAGLFQSDFDRRLTERGEQDAPLMGARLQHHGIQPDLIIASPAKRTVQTALTIALATGLGKRSITLEDSLYQATPGILETVISGIPDEVKTVFIIGHNPGISELANELSPSFRVDHLPTCGIVAAHLQAEEWTSFPLAKKEIFLFDYPKKQA